MKDKDETQNAEQTQKTTTDNENGSEKALAEHLIDLQKQLDEANKKRAEADARAIELVKALRNSGTQKTNTEEKKLTLNELVKDLFE